MAVIAICDANILIKHCEAAGGTVVWGLQMLLKLVEAKLLTVSHAEKVARKINQVNPEINEKILQDFLNKLGNQNYEKRV